MPSRSGRPRSALGHNRTWRRGFAMSALSLGAWHAVINENEPGSVQKSAQGESQIGVHIHLHRFAVA
jgi:hypothetical protein